MKKNSINSMRKNFAQRLRNSLIADGNSGRYLVYAVLSIGIIIFLNSVILQLSWILERPVDFITYKFAWGATQIVLLLVCLLLRRRMRYHSGQTILERTGFRLVILTIVGSILVSLIIVLTDWIKPIATNTILSFIHFLCFAVPPTHITKAFSMASVIFLITGLVLLFVPLASDILYGLSWLVASIVISYKIHRETNVGE